MKLLRIRFKNGMTLIEIMIVLVIIGIIAAFAIPGFRGSRLRARDREARTQLTKVQDAERMHRLQTNTYRACNVNGGKMAECEAILDLDFPPAPPRGYWDYSVPDADTSTFCAQAVNDDDPPTRAWHIEQGDDAAAKCDCNNAICTF